MSDTTTIIAVSLSVVVTFAVGACVVYIRCYSKLEEEQEAWSRKSIDLDGPEQLPMYELPKSYRAPYGDPKNSSLLLLAHEEEKPGAQTETQGQMPQREGQKNADRYSYHTYHTNDRDEGESKFTETTVGRFFEDLDGEQQDKKEKDPFDDDSDDDIDV